jgi:hypothetical protein
MAGLPGQHFSSRKRGDVGLGRDYVVLVEKTARSGCLGLEKKPKIEGKPMCTMNKKRRLRIKKFDVESVIFKP